MLLFVSYIQLYNARVWQCSLRRFAVLAGVVQEWSRLPFHAWHLGQAMGDGGEHRGQRGGEGGGVAEHGGTVQVFRERLAFVAAPAVALVS